MKQDYDWRRDIKTRYHGNYGELRVSHLQNVEFAQLKTKATYSIKYVNHGTEVYFVDNQEITVHEGDMLLLQNNERYMGQVPTQTITQGLCIDLSDDMFSSMTSVFLDDEQALPSFDMNLAVFPKSINRLDGLLSSIAKVGPMNNLLLEEQMNALNLDFKDFIFPYDTKADSLPFKKTSTKKEVLHRLLKAQAFIHDNCTQMFQLKELAEAAHISEFHFLRLFKHFFGCTPSAYLEKIKMERAKTMIASNRYQLKEIAYQLGYADQKYFSRRFKRHFGYAPSTLRKAEHLIEV